MRPRSNRLSRSNPSPGSAPRAPGRLVPAQATLSVLDAGRKASSCPALLPQTPASWALEFFALQFASRPVQLQKFQVNKKERPVKGARRVAARTRIRSNSYLSGVKHRPETANPALIQCLDRLPSQRASAFKEPSGVRLLEPGERKYPSPNVTL